MIAHLRGRLISKHPNQAIVEAAGVGYDVTITVPTFSDLPAHGQRSRAAHSYSCSRRCAGALWISAPGREAALREADHRQRHRAEAGDHHPERHGDRRHGGRDSRQRFRAAYKIPGIGKKTAERMCVELRDKLEGFGAAATGEESFRRRGRRDLGADKSWLSASAGRESGRARGASAGRENFDAIFRAALGGLSK